jgi:hypothetical protein
VEPQTRLPHLLRTGTELADQTSETVKAGQTRCAAICEISSQAIDPKSDRFPADDNAARSQQVFNIGCAHGKPVIRPDSLSNDLMRIKEAL